MHFDNESDSYSFISILLKLYMCYGHGLKICMWFGYNPQIIFCHFFHSLNLSNFLGVLVNGYRVPLVCNSSYNLIPILYFGNLTDIATML